MGLNPIPFTPDGSGSPFTKPEEAPGFIESSIAQTGKNTSTQALARGVAWLTGAITEQEGYNPWSEMQGYEKYADTLIWARSPQQMSVLKNIITNTERDNDTLARSSYPILSGLAGGVFDPLNYLPIPIAGGLGFVRGAVVGAASNAAMAVATEPLRIAADPTAGWDEFAPSVGVSAIFGAVLGGAVGAGMKAHASHVRQTRESVTRLMAALDEADGINFARPFNAAEESYTVVSGRINQAPGAEPSLVEITTRDVPIREKQAADGQIYHYDDTFGWVKASERGKPDPSPVDQAILDELGMPERGTENVMRVDELRAKVDFEKGEHLKARDGVPGLREGDVRTPSEYVTFRQIEAVYRKRLSQEPGETRESWLTRVREKSLEELKASRAPSSVARRGVLAPWLDKINLSPVAKAIRLFANDTLLTDLPLQIAGDYGWATRANEFGYKTPPSLLMRAMRHNTTFFEIKAALDDQFVKYSQQNAKATSVTGYGMNYSATAAGLKARASGGRIMTRDTFARMAGQAVFEKGDFSVDGFRVVPEAREAAKVWTRAAIRIEAQARELGIFYDQAAIQRTFQTADAQVLKMREKMIRWMWGGNDSPTALTPAIKVGDQLFTGKSHDEAVMNALDALGPETQITAEMHGYVPREMQSRSQGDVTMPDAGAGNGNWGWVQATGAKTITKPKFTVKDKFVPGMQFLGKKNFEDYLASAPEFMLDKRVTDEASFFKMREREIRDNFDRSLWSLARYMGDQNLTLHGQGSRYGYNGVVYSETPDGPKFFRSIQAHEFLSKMPKEWLDTLQQTVDQLFPHRLDPLHTADLQDSLTDPKPQGSEAYGTTTEQEQANYDAGYRTGGLFDSHIMDDGTGLYEIMGHIRVAVDQPNDLNVMNTLWHEVLHAMKATGRMTPEEWSVLAGAARERGWHTAFSTDDNGKVIFHLSDEEAIAHAIGHWAENPDDPRIGPLTPEAKSFFQRIVDLWRRMENWVAGMPPESKKTLADIFDSIGSGEMGRREARKFGSWDAADRYRLDTGISAQRIGGGFRKMEDVWTDRLNSLSPDQKRFMDDWKKELDELVSERDAARLELDTLRSRPPNEFRDEFGDVEPYFGRYYNMTAIGSERVRFTKLLASWYGRDNPVGAMERAELTVDGMLKTGEADDVQPVSTVPGLRHLHKRSLDIPNSFKITDPELGEIKLADFINTNLEQVSEAYIRGMGHKIEAARQFGDSGLTQAFRDARAHFRDTYLIPAQKAGKPTARMQARFDDYMGQLDMTRKIVLGGLREREPWARDNRTARFLKNWASLSSMGGILVTTLSEAARLPMVNGFRLMVPTIFARLNTDMKVLKENLDLNMHAGEIMDLAMDAHGARVMEGNEADPGGGGSYIERLLERSMPGFYKLTGLTHWTVMAKDMVMLGAQHKVMDLARNYDVGNNGFKLASWGISERDAALLAQMPVEKKGGLILPNVGNWAGADGRRARTLLLDAIHAEARRAIVTPSAADKSLLFYGIASWKGKKIGESDVYTLPLQFMSYGMAAGQKVVMSALQGRDQNSLMGALAMVTLGTMTAYLSASQNKPIEELMLDGYEKSGVGGFLFGDLNGLIERYSRNSVGIRPMLGFKGRFGNETGIGGYSDIGGPGLGMMYDLTLDQYLNEDLSASNRAQAFRRAIPLNNLLWFAGLPRYFANQASRPFQ